MAAEKIVIDPAHPSDMLLRRAVEVLRKGGIIVIPTDTVYGLAANGFNSAACNRLYELKDRPRHKPFIIMPSSIEMVHKIAEVSPNAASLMKKFWPGALTLVLHTTTVGQMLMGGRANVGVRIPASLVTQKLLAMCDFPLATTSANRSNNEPPSTAAAAAAYFNNGIDLIIDAGPCAVGMPSTVVDITHFPGTVVRRGAIPRKQVLKYLFSTERTDDTVAHARKKK